ncbi:hypothetical protein [Stenomitos frigidus]|uniref:hypothetical protein n=1 Tax=Stenomitos frigidus TaxID=1886765 RepID=UPI0015E7A568|nr:hypothetical protein [Stenomitos frigidus]
MFLPARVDAIPILAKNDRFHLMGVTPHPLKAEQRLRSHLPHQTAWRQTGTEQS